MPRIKSIESNDPTYHRREFKRFLNKMKREDPRWADNYELFIKQLLVIFSDNPPHSWRFSITTYKYPSFRVINKKTGRSTYFLNVYENRLVIPHKFFMKEFQPLFTVHNDMYGEGCGQIVDFAKFGSRKQTPYIDAIKVMLNQTDILSLNHPAHQ